LNYGLGVTLTCKQGDKKEKLNKASTTAAKAC